MGGVGWHAFPFVFALNYLKIFREGQNKFFILFQFLNVLAVMIFCIFEKLFFVFFLPSFEIGFQFGNFKFLLVDNTPQHCDQFLSVFIFIDSALGKWGKLTAMNHILKKLIKQFIEHQCFFIFSSGHLFSGSWGFYWCRIIGWSWILCRGGNIGTCIYLCNCVSSRVGSWLWIFRGIFFRGFGDSFGMVLTCLF